MPLPDHRNSPRLARDALVLGPSAALNRDPSSTSSVNNSFQTAPQLCVSQQSSTSQTPHLVSRSGQLQEQGFSVEVAERIAAPQRSSVKQVSDFFMYLYQDLNRRPRPLMVTGLPLLTPWAQWGTIFHKAQTFTGYCFHRDHPRSSRNLPKWNLSVLNELTKAPFEPMNDTDLKHLTLKTAFLLAFASGKRRS